MTFPVPSDERLKELATESDQCAEEWREDADIYDSQHRGHAANDARRFAQGHADIAAALRALAKVRELAELWGLRAKELHSEEFREFMNGCPTNIVKRIQSDALAAASARIGDILDGKETPAAVAEETPHA